MRRLLAVCLCLIAAVVAASCTDLLELDDHVSATQALCSQLDGCYGADFYPDCAASTAARLEASDPDTRAAFLVMFADTNCLEDCKSARQCLDALPICGSGGVGCGVTASCCGFTAGEATCSDICCVPDGAACSVGQPCCNGDCIEGSCGGGECGRLGADCELASDCCGELVCHPLDRRCVDCLPPGGECISDFDCCDQTCLPDFEGVLRCQEATCGVELARCDGPEDCCGDLSCVFIGNFGVCQLEGCIPAGQLCDQSGQFPCCSGICAGDTCAPETGCDGKAGDPCNGVLPCCEGSCSAGKCCVAPGSACGNDADCCQGACLVDALCAATGNPADCNKYCTIDSCDVPGTPCTDPSLCCSGQCGTSGGGDSTCCAPCEAHNPCHAGPPLNPRGCDVDAPEGLSEQACIAEVCDDPNLASCCCEWWTDVCTQAAKQICGLSCMNG